MNNVQFMSAPRYHDSVSAPPTTFELVLICFAAIHTIYSAYVFFLDLSSVIILFQSGMILYGVLFLFVGTLKHVCQALWCLVNTRYKTLLTPTTYLIICGAGELILGASLIGYCVLIYGQTHNIIDILMHPHVIEFGTFIIANTLMIFLELSHLSDYTMVPMYYYEPQQIEMPKMYTLQPQQFSGVPMPMMYAAYP